MGRISMEVFYFFVNILKTCKQLKYIFAPKGMIDLLHKNDNDKHLKYYNAKDIIEL